MEIGKFAISWNCFERFYCDNLCSPAKIREKANDILIEDGKQSILASVLNERRSWYNQITFDYVATGLHPGNAGNSTQSDMICMQNFMDQTGDDLNCGCLLVIYRIRNNLMHGLKMVEELNNQLKLFNAVNGVLESIRERI